MSAGWPASPSFGPGSRSRTGAAIPGDQTLGDLRMAAVQIITSAARLRTKEGDQFDLADFLARVASSAATNIGGPEALLAGRSGSWEADDVRQLIEGTIGYDRLQWHLYRTEPIKVALNVAELIELSDRRLGLLGFDAASDAVCDAVWMELNRGPAVDDRIDELLESLEQRYTDEYRRTTAIASTKLFSSWRRRWGCRRLRSSWTSIRNQRGGTNRPSTIPISRATRCCPTVGARSLGRHPAERCHRRFQRHQTTTTWIKKR